MLTAERREQTATKGWKPEVLFLVVACGIAWIIWLPALLGPAGLRVIKYQAFLPFFISLGTIGPTIASFVATRYESGRWEMPSRFLPTAGARSWLSLIVAPALVIIGFVIIPYMVCVAPGHKLIALRPFAALLTVWPNILGGPLEEEFGWRGYLLPRLSARMGKLWATLVVGIVWASWHLPLMLTHVWGISFWYFLPLLVALSVFASLSYFATGRSILGAVVLHYVFNMSSKTLNTALLGQPTYGNRDVAEVILISMISVALLIIAVTRGRFGERA